MLRIGCRATVATEQQCAAARDGITHHAQRRGNILLELLRRTLSRGREIAQRTKQGRYVRFNVRVKRPGLQVKARPGYAEQLEYLKRRTKPEPARTPVAAALANPVSVPGVPMRVVATPFKGDSSDVTADLAVKFIRECAGKKERFLAVVWFGSPHAPHAAQ